MDDILLDDDDLIAKLDGEINKDFIEDTPGRFEQNKLNPVEENLIKQLSNVQNRIDQTNTNIDTIKSVTNRILNKLSVQGNYQETISSDSDSDLFSDEGHPVIKRKQNRSREQQQVLDIRDIWQRVIDDHWVIGVVLKNNTSCVLKEPTLYVTLKNRDNIEGVSTFWTLEKDTYWYTTEEIQPHATVVGTSVIRLPNFDIGPCLTLVGTVFTEIGEKIFQTPLNEQELAVEDIIDGTFAVTFTGDSSRFSILALKMMSIERYIEIPKQSDCGIGKRMMKFFEENHFKEVFNVAVARNEGSLQYCILSLLPPDELNVKILITARSEAQLTSVIQLLRYDFPGLIDTKNHQDCEDAAEALQEELETYLNCKDLVRIQQARTKTDILIL